ADLHGVLERPILQAHDHDGQIRQINDGTDAECRERLAGPQFADLAAFGFFVVHGTPPSSASSPPSSSIPKSSRIRLAVGSTSRSELRQVNSSHCSMLGLRSRPTVTPSFFVS